MKIPDLDRFLYEVTHEAAKLSADQERQAALGLSADYAQRLSERSTFRRLLASNELDAARFRWWFAQPHSAHLYSLDGWRERIDAQMMKEAK